MFSSATALLRGDTNGHTDLYVRDLETGTLERASFTTDGKQPGNESTGEVRSVNHAAIAGTAMIAEPTVALGTGPAGADPRGVGYERVSSSDGRFEALIPESEGRAWARICLGETCTYSSTSVA